MPRFLPDKERPAELVRVGDEIFMPRDEAWCRILRRLDGRHRIGFIFVDGGDLWVQPGERVRSRSALD